MSEPSDMIFSFGSVEESLRVLGPGDSHVRLLEQQIPGVKLQPRGLTVRILSDDPVASARALSVLEELGAIASRGTLISDHVVGQVLSMLKRAEAASAPAGLQPESSSAGTVAAAGITDPVQDRSPLSPSQVLTTSILSSRGKNIRPKTQNQQSYVQSIDDHTIVFGLGPAGTGKTYLAMAKAVQALQRKEVSRIILTRPAVEAGERLGYLPGTLSDKIDPYLRPLYDALHDMMDPESIPRLIEAGTIEVAPLAFMRGRTLNDAFIILDEAQNTTADQMKMFLTRLGFGSKMVVTGDASQIDLPGGVRSGLHIVETILDGVDDIDFVHLSADDVVRHRLVSDIVSAYGLWDERQTARLQERQKQKRSDSSRTRTDKDSV